MCLGVSCQMALHLTKACLSLKRGSILHLYPKLQQEPWRKLKGINPHFNSTNNRSHIQSDALLVFLLHHIFCSLQRQSLQVKSDSRQLLSQRHHRLWYSLEYGVLHHPSDTFKPLMWRGSSPHSPRCAAFCLAGTNTTTICLYVSLEIIVQTTQSHSSQRWKESLKWNKPPKSSVCRLCAFHPSQKKKKKWWGVSNN